MEKGLLIFGCVLIILLLLNFGLIRLMNVAEEKKSRYRKVFWYFYGSIFSISGGVNLIENKSFNLIFIFQLAIGIAILLLNFLGKIETKKPRLKK